MRKTEKRRKYEKRGTGRRENEKAEDKRREEK